MSWREGPLSAGDVRLALSAAIGTLGHEKSAVADAIKTFDLIFPELTQYRDGWFRTSRFAPENVDAWFDRLKGDVAAVERMVNHLDILEDYPGGPDSGEYETEWSNALGEVLVFAWSMWARMRYGIEINCSIVFFDAEQGDDPDPQTVTFCTVRSAE